MTTTRPTGSDAPAARDGRLVGRVAVITGGSSGIGRAIALRFAAEGASVAIGDVRPDPIEGGPPTADLLDADGHDALFVPTDVSSGADVDRLVHRTVERFGRIDVLVNNAAVSTGTPLLETSDDDWDHVLGVGLTGVFLLSRRVVAQMLTQAPVGEVRGRIVNVSSQHGLTAAPRDIAYGTAKSGVAYLTRQIATDYAADGIVCNAVAPGKIVTGTGPRDADPDWQGYWRSRTPWPRLGVPDDVARAAVFLASDEATYVTGVNLMVDGGWSAS